MNKRTIAAAVPLATGIIWGICVLYLEPALKDALLGPDSELETSLTLTSVLTFLQIAIAIVLTMIIGAQGPVEAVRELGLRAEILRPIAFALLATVPVWIFLWAVTGLVPLPSPTAFAASLLMALAAGLFDVAFVFGQFHRRARLAFAPAAIVAALVLAFMAQLERFDQQPEISAALIAARALLLLLFFWIFVRFRFNPWPVIALLVFLPHLDAAALRPTDMTLMAKVIFAIAVLPWIIAALLLLAGPHLPGLRRIVPAAASPPPAERPQDAF